MQEQIAKQITLEELRKQIDLVDTLLIKCLAKRQDIVLQIAKIKKQENLPIFCQERENQLIEERKMSALLLDLDSDFIKDIFKNILNNSRKTQEEIRWK